MSERDDMAESIRRHSHVHRKSDTPRPRDAAPIGLSGFAGSGKTSAATWLEALHGYQRQHIADPLRRMLASLLREYGYCEPLIERYLIGDLKESVIPQFGRTGREMQISLGTEWMREQVDVDGWANIWLHRARQADRPVMNDSVRFPNEEDAVRGAGGITIMITRPGTGPAAFKWPRLGPLLYRWFGLMWGVHDSERVDRLRPDFVVVNDGTLDQLRNRVAALVLRHACR